LRRSLVEQMGSNAQVVFDVVPGFERLSRAASAISGKIFVDDVVGKVIKASVIRAGATRALLLLLKGSEFIVRAEATGDAREGRSQRSPSGSGRGPERLVNFVVRTCESVVLDDATRDNTYRDDPFVVAHRPHSILCVAHELPNGGAMPPP
jgi:GAF domain-containing protein